MPAYRCDYCGRFCPTLHDVWANPPHSIEAEVCDQCFANRKD